MRTDIRMAAPAVLAGLIAACAGGSREGASPSPSPSQPATLEQAPATAGPGPASPGAGAGGVTAQISPTQGNGARGTVTFEPAGDGVRVTAHIEGLPPGEHGFHLHEHGDCSAPDASSAGDHWNPTQQPHGGPDSPQRHAGDLGNVTADAGGMAHMERVVPGLGLDGPQSVLGRAVVVHARADDLKTQPTGNAGARLGCGVIGGGPAGTGAAPAARRDPS